LTPIGDWKSKGKEPWVAWAASLIENPENLTNPKYVDVLVRNPNKDKAVKLSGI